MANQVLRPGLARRSWVCGRAARQALVCVWLCLAACAEDAAPPPSTAANDSGLPVTTPAADSSAMEGDAGAAPVNMGDAGMNDAGGTSTPAMDGGTSSPKPDAGSVASVDAASADGGVAPPTDSGGADAQVPGEAPAPVTAPYVWGVGLGVTDLPGAVKFYTEVMKMTVEKEGIKRDDRTETTLYASQAKRGARLVLMSFDDKRNTRKITAKLVWQAPSPSAINTAARQHPDYVSRLNFGIVQFDGPETYIQEVGSGFDSAGRDSPVPYPVVIGFSVSDLAASRRFYTALGMTESRLGSFPVTDATGSATITEYTVKWATGSGLVLQDWSTDRNSKDNPVKVVMFVPDAQVMADKLVAAGGSIAKAAERTPVYDNRLLVVAKDRDGYILELVQ